MKLYFIECKSKYCVGGIGHAFTLANSKEEAARSYPEEDIIKIRVATPDDIKAYGRGRSKKEISDNLKKSIERMKRL